MDFLVSLALIVLVIGLMLQFAEVATYSAKQTQEQRELEAVAITASNLLVLNPAFSCELTMPAGPGPQIETEYLTHCIAVSKLNGSNITKGALGIADPYRFCIGGIVNCGAEANAENVFTVVRKIVTHPTGFVTKKELEICIRGPGIDEICNFDTVELELKVWKA